MLPRAILVAERLLDPAEGDVRRLISGPGRAAVVLAKRVGETIVALGEPAEEQVSEVADACRRSRPRAPASRSAFARLSSRNEAHPAEMQVGLGVVGVERQRVEVMAGGRASASLPRLLTTSADRLAAPPVGHERLPHAHLYDDAARDIQAGVLGNRSSPSCTCSEACGRSSHDV